MVSWNKKDITLNDTLLIITDTINTTKQNHCICYVGSPLNLNITNHLCISSISSSSIYYPDKFSLLLGLASPFTALLLQPSISPASICTTPLFFMSSSTTSIHHFTGHWPQSITINSICSIVDGAPKSVMTTSVHHR